MLEIYELVDLSKQISAVMDDMELDGRKVLGVNVKRFGGIEVHLMDDVFFSSFDTFSIERSTYNKTTFIASKTIKGVEFFALTEDVRIWLRTNKFKLKKRHKKAYTQGNACRRLFKNQLP